MADTCIVGCFPPLADDVCEAARAAGLNAVGTGGTLEAVLRLARKRLPGVLLLHALLPGLDASRIEATLDEMALYRRPAIVYMVPEGATEKNTTLSRELRTLFPSVSARPSSDEIRFAAEEARRAQVSPERLERARRLMEKMGIPPGAARESLACAAVLAYLDASRAHRLSSEILPAVALRFSVEPRRALEAMRRAIERAWTTGDIEKQYALFGNTIDEQKGNPTMGAFLATAAEILRLRGENDD